VAKPISANVKKLVDGGMSAEAAAALVISDPIGEPRPDAVVLAYVCGNEVAYSWHRSMVQLIGHDA
jgi:hypothetical protein